MAYSYAFIGNTLKNIIAENFQNIKNKMPIQAQEVSRTIS
jgi:hypothetical protein